MRGEQCGIVFVHPAFGSAEQQHSAAAGHGGVQGAGQVTFAYIDAAEPGGHAQPCALGSGDLAADCHSRPRGPAWLASSVTSLPGGRPSSRLARAR